MKPTKPLQRISFTVADCCFSLFHFSEKTPVSEENYEGLHCHRHYELHITEKTAYSFKTPDETITLHNGEMLIFEPGDLHCTSVPFFSNVVLEFSVTKVASDKNLNLFSYISALFHQCAGKPIDASPKLAPLINTFEITDHSENISSLCDEQRTISQIVELLIKCCENAVEKGDRKIPSPQFNASTAEEGDSALLDYYVNRSDYSLSDIAKAMNYSDKQISRLMQKNYGMSLTNLRKQRNIETALLFLTKHPELSNEQIAIRSGFNSLRHFYNCISHATGKTPNEMRMMKK